MRGPKSPDHLAKLRENIAEINIDRLFSEELRLKKISKANGHKVEVTDTVTGETKEYPSTHVAGQELGYSTSAPTVRSYMKTEKLFRGTYKIVLKEPGSQLGRTHCKESRLLMARAKRGTKLSEATKLAITLSQPYAQRIEVTDLNSGIRTEYDSIKKAAKALNCSDSAMAYNLNSKKQNPFKGRYVLRKID